MDSEKGDGNESPGFQIGRSCFDTKEGRSAVTRRSKGQVLTSDSLFPVTKGGKKEEEKEDAGA